MHVSLRHKLSYKFVQPARNVIRVLRLTPRSHEGQHVVDWQIDVDVDCILKAGEDGFGNITHTFTAKGPCEEMTITVMGEVDTFDAAGVVRGSAERMPRELYMRETPLTQADEALRGFASETATHCETTLDKLHGLLDGIHAPIPFDATRADAAGAGAAFAESAGNGADLAHIYTACARYLGFGARIASGYVVDDDDTATRHAWSEVFVAGLGWTGFDAAFNICPQDRHVRLAIALDYLAAAPIRGVADEAVTEEIVARAPSLSNWEQSQG